MGARTTSTTSGGGAATPVANDFMAWLSSQMNGTPYQSTLPSGTPANSQYAQAWQNGTLTPMSQEEKDRITAQSGIEFQPPGGAAGGTPNPMNPGQMSGGSSASPFQNAFNSMLSGQVIDPSGANAAIASGIGSGASQFGENYQNPYTSQQYSGANLSQLGTNFGAGQTGMADLSTIAPTAQSNYNFNNGSSQYTDVLNQLLGRGSQLAGSANAGQANIGAGISLDPATQFDMNDPYFAALKTQQQRALQEATAANNARFGAQGAGAIGSGAQLANSNLQSAASADQTVALQQALQGLQQQDLAERGTRANVGLTSRGQDAQVGIANAGNATQASIANQGNNSQMLASMLGATNTARGQDLQNNQFMQNLGLDQALKNAGFTNDRNSQDLLALISNQGLGNTFGINAATLNNNAMQSNNQNALTASRNLNDFNLTNQNQLANNQTATSELNSRNHGVNQASYQGMLGLGQRTNEVGNQNIANALQQLFSSFGQASGFGIEQRNTQVNQQGSPWGGIAGAVLPVAGQVVSGLLNRRNGN